MKKLYLGLVVALFVVLCSYLYPLLQVAEQMVLAGGSGLVPTSGAVGTIAVISNSLLTIGVDAHYCWGSSPCNSSLAN